MQRILLHPLFCLALGLSSTLASSCSMAGADGARDNEEAEVLLAVVRLEPVGDSDVRGQVRFQQSSDGLRVTGRIEGLTPGKHGFHVHQYGDLSDATEGKSAGGHYAPKGQPHGRPEDEQRHVGDLGNIVANEQGIASIEIMDDVIELNGETSILGRALVIHSGEDKFTQPSGDAGSRVAFGVIGVGEGEARSRESASNDAQR